MNATTETGFALGKLTGLDWAEIEGHAAEINREDGDVLYRGQFLCTVYNDEGGGDTLDGDGNHMTDEQVQARINEIDAAQ